MTAIRENRTESARVPFKVELALSLLLNAYRAGRFVTALDARRVYEDTAWHSTVAALRKQGIEFEQCRYKHRHRGGGVANFQAYRLRPDCVEQAARLLAFYRSAPHRKRRQDDEQGRDTTAA